MGRNVPRNTCDAGLHEAKSAIYNYITDTNFDLKVAAHNPRDHRHGDKHYHHRLRSGQDNHGASHIYHPKPQGLDEINLANMGQANLES